VRAIPLNMMTLYADLMQNVGVHETKPGSIATKTVNGHKYVYVTVKDGSARVETILGRADDPYVIEQAGKIKLAAQRAKALRSTVTLLKGARIAAPTLPQGRILGVIANAGLFKRGMTLVGTVAYQSYPCVLGYHLGATAYATNDIDLSVAEFVAAAEQEDICSILKRADPSFEPHWHATDTLPRMFRSNAFQVDVVTRYGRGRKSPVLVESLGCSAAALSFQEYPAEETIEIVALYGAGVLIRVPTPVRYAIHKLIVAQQRGLTEAAKRQKDLRQAGELIDVFSETDEAALLDHLEDARSRGKAWKAAITASLKELGREIRDGRPPVQAGSPR
jgi:hypothetical protein